MATDAQLAEARRLRPAIFRDCIIGIGPMEEYAVVGFALAARRGLRSTAEVLELVEALAFRELGPTPLGRELVDGVISRIRDYVRA